jgi:uncharacterized protein
VSLGLRIVLDTNILVSAGLKPEGLEARVLAMVWAGELIPLATEWTWAEYDRVLRRKKFAALQDWMETALRRLERHVHWCVSHERLSIATDDNDNRFLECAVTGGAEFLLTGNARHFPAEYAGIRVSGARAFLSALPQTAGDFKVQR